MTAHGASHNISQACNACLAYKTLSALVALSRHAAVGAAAQRAVASFAPAVAQNYRLVPNVARSLAHCGAWRGIPHSPPVCRRGWRDRQTDRRQSEGSCRTTIAHTRDRFLLRAALLRAYALFISSLQPRCRAHFCCFGCYLAARAFCILRAAPGIHIAARVSSRLIIVNSSPRHHLLTLAFSHRLFTRTCLLPSYPSRSLPHL